MGSWPGGGSGSWPAARPPAAQKVREHAADLHKAGPRVRVAAQAALDQGDVGGVGVRGEGGEQRVGANQPVAGLAVRVLPNVDAPGQAVGKAGAGQEAAEAAGVAVEEAAKWQLRRRLGKAGEGQDDSRGSGY